MIELTRNFWVAAAGLANTRTSQFNKRGRAESTDRGPLNLLVDIQGVACELIALKYINDFIRAEWFEHTMLDKRGANGLDIMFGTKHGRTFKLDVKGLFVTDMDRKWRGNFLINPTAVDKAEQDCLHFAPVITTFGADRAYVGQLMRWEDVVKWPTRDFGYGSVPHYLPMAEVVMRYFRIPPEELFTLRDRQFKLARLDEDLAALTLPEKLPESLVDHRTMDAPDIIKKMCDHIDQIQKVG